MKSFTTITSILIGFLSNQSAAFVPSSLKLSPSFVQNKLFSATSSESETDIFTVNVALTREVDKNGKLKQMINDHPTKKMLQNALQLNVLELPCVEHATGPDEEAFKKLVDNKSDDDNSLSNFDYIVITSPESAKVFSESVKNDDENLNDVKIAAVGKATKKMLTDLGFNVDFLPSKATGQTLGEELPPVDKVKLTRVLYPASAKAENTIQETLESRKDASFTVTRFNTYDTLPVKFTDEQLDVAMGDINLVCFGSPSSVKAWVANVDRALGIEDLSDDEKKATPGSNGYTIAVCIGTTTSRECLNSGRWQAMDIYYPKGDPGMQGWADSCLQAAGDVMENSFWA